MITEGMPKLISCKIYFCEKGLLVCFLSFDVDKILKLKISGKGMNFIYCAMTGFTEQLQAHSSPQKTTSLSLDTSICHSPFSIFKIGPSRYISYVSTIPKLGDS